MKPIVLILSLFLLCSCNHLIRKTHNRSSDVLSIPNISHFELPSSVSYKNMEANYKSAYGEVPLDEHPQVDKWVRYFTGRGRSVMKTYLERSSRYLPIMKSVMREAKLPEDLVYIALIESGFSPKAHSRSNAVGYWQFIHGTGKNYGLKINGFVDERRDPVLSTRAAVEYFKDLYSLFGSWHLAMSAYNAGEYRVNRTVLKHYNRDFWYLISKKALPRETRNYVPKFIAAVKIARNPKKYGFYNIQFQEPLNYDVVPLSKSISLKKLAKNLQVNHKDLKKLNPMYKGEYVPIYGRKTLIRVPVGMKKTAQASLRDSFMKKPSSGYHYHYWYRVKRGDSLSRIAYRNKTTISSLRRVNGLGRRSLIRVGQRLKVPTRNVVRSRNIAKSQKSSSGYYTVRKGDSLSRIARVHKIKVSQLRAYNKLSSKSMIHPRQKLRVISLAQLAKLQNKTANRSIASVKTSKFHTVNRGETLIVIAKKYGVSLPELMKANSLNFKSILSIGARLKIPH